LANLNIEFSSLVSKYTFSGFVMSGIKFPMDVHTKLSSEMNISNSAKNIVSFKAPCKTPHMLRGLPKSTVKESPGRAADG